ncbi:hypothetical protein PENSPDRAFT_252556 [Peniophora sp. CONT]|nr:hypothetical protein PENSPDRAFT_252556 [Peniophora sp. CONT]
MPKRLDYVPGQPDVLKRELLASPERRTGSMFSAIYALAQYLLTPHLAKQRYIARIQSASVRRPPSESDFISSPLRPSYAVYICRSERRYVWATDVRIRDRANGKVSSVVASGVRVLSQAALDYALRLDVCARIHSLCDLFAIRPPVMSTGLDSRNRLEHLSE